MTAGSAMNARVVIGIFVVLGYAVLAHTLSTLPQISAPATLFAIMPLAIVPLAIAPLAFALALKPALRKWSVLLFIGAVVIAFNPHWRQWSAQHLAWVYFAQDSALNVGLAVLFGATLRRGKIPLCSRLLLLLQRQPNAQTLRYTRAITWAWTLFFGAMVTISTVLFFSAAHITWSTFANLLYWPLLIAMFGIEYAARLLVLPRDQRAGFFATIRAFTSFYGERDKRASAIL